MKYEMGKPEHAALPDDYFAYAREIETPVLLTTGADNKVFSRLEHRLPRAPAGARAARSTS